MWTSIFYPFLSHSHCVSYTMNAPQKFFAPRPAAVSMRRFCTFGSEQSQSMPGRPQWFPKTLSIELLTTLDHENQPGQCQLSTGKYWEWIHEYYNESPSQEEMVKHGTSWMAPSCTYIDVFHSHAGAAQAHNGTHFLAQMWTWQQTKTSLGPTKRFPTIETKKWTCPSCPLWRRHQKR